MKSDHKVFGILRNVDNQLGVAHESGSKTKKPHRVSFHVDVIGRVKENNPVENQLLRARQMANAINGDRLFKQASELEANPVSREDISKAFDLYSTASKLGHMDSIFRLGEIFKEVGVAKKSIDELDFARNYFEKVGSELLHPKHDEAMDHIQDIYLILAEMYEYGDNTEQNLHEALEYYKNAPERTDAIRHKIINLSLLNANQLLSNDRLDLDDLEKALHLLTDVSYMCPFDTDLTDRIKNLTFEIGRECYYGTKISQNLQAAFKHLEFLYAEEPDYPELRDLLARVIKQGILPYGYDQGNYARAFRVSSYFLQFVFIKKNRYQEINHDSFIKDLILDSVTELLSKRPKIDENPDHQGTRLWNFVLDAYNKA